METRVEKAIEKRDRGYNCAQAVACTYCDLVGLDEKTMFKVIEGFGSGLANMHGTCGAVSGAGFSTVESSINSYKPQKCGIFLSNFIFLYVACVACLWYNGLEVIMIEALF